jgi:AraC-like DNA-binding protein
MSRYLRLHNEALATRVEEADGLVLIREEVLDGGAGPLRQSTELIVGVLYRILRLFLGASWRPQAICFAHAAPASTATHLRVFGMPVRFGQDFDGIVCRAADLEVPLPTYDPGIARQVRRYLDTLLAQSSASKLDEVRQLIVGLLPLGICSADCIAEQLGVDRRTVHHQLSRQGQNYSGVLNSVRSELVTRYITNRERPLSDVAAMLGFSSLSAFSRWFGGQFGCSVTEWRARQAR